METLTTGEILKDVPACRMPDSIVVFLAGSFAAGSVKGDIHASDKKYYLEMYLLFYKLLDQKQRKNLRELMAMIRHDPEKVKDLLQKTREIQKLELDEFLENVDPDDF